MLNLPNSLTTLRIFMVPLLVAVLLTKRETPILGLVIFLLALLTDYLDGYLARRRGEVTTLGTLLDPVADKLLTASAFISLVDLDFAPAWMVMIIVGREFAVSGLRSIASSQGVTIPASRWGKYKTGSQGVAISILIMTKHLGEFRWLGDAALWIVMLFAFISAADYFISFYRRLGLDGRATSRV